ncbi:hypothetical protein NMG60_11009113 [Bertholletia excelsa]
MKRRFRQAFIAIKERGCVSYAKMATIGGFCNLDLIVVKATSPEDLPLQEKYVHELIKIFSLSPSSFRAFALTFTRRFSKTDCWPVALKCLILLHRLLRSLPENSPFRAELLCVRSHGLLSLFPCHFQDSSSSFSEDYTLFIKSYAHLLDEALHYCFSIDYDAHQQKEQEKTTAAAAEEEEEGDETEAKAETLTEKGKVNEENPRLLQVLPQLQSLLERVMQCRPQGAASRSYLVQSAMKLTVRDSFACYTSFRKQLVVLLDNLLHMPYKDSLLAFDIYKRAAIQANQLSEFYDFCKSMGLRVGWYEYPFVDQVPQILVQALETFLGGMWQFTDSSSSSPFPSALESLCGEMVPLIQMSCTSSLRRDDSEETLGPRREKIQVSDKREERPKLEGGGEMGPLIQFDEEEDFKNDKNVSWETLLEASDSVNTTRDLFFNPSGYLYGENNLRNGGCQAEPQKVEGWEVQIYNFHPCALNPFYHQYATKVPFT